MLTVRYSDKGPPVRVQRPVQLSTSRGVLHYALLHLGMAQGVQGIDAPSVRGQVPTVRV